MQAEIRTPPLTMDKVLPSFVIDAIPAIKYA